MLGNGLVVVCLVSAWLLVCGTIMVVMRARGGHVVFGFNRGGAAGGRKSKSRECRACVDCVVGGCWSVEECHAWSYRGDIV